MTLSIMGLSITTLSIRILSITKLSIMDLISTFSMIIAVVMPSVVYAKCHFL